MTELNLYYIIVSVLYDKRWHIARKEQNHGNGVCVSAYLNNRAQSGCAYRSELGSYRELVAVVEISFYGEGEVMNLKSALATTALEWLVWDMSLCRKEVELPADDISMYTKIFRESWVLPEALQAAVHKGLLWCGYKAYRLLKAEAYVYPNQLPSPEAFGYAVAHGIFSPQEIEGIHFDDGETLDVYRAYANGLCDSVIEQIITGTVKKRGSSVRYQGDFWRRGLAGMLVINLDEEGRKK